MNRSRQIIIFFFMLWACLIMGGFMFYSFSTEKAFNDPKNTILRHKHRGEILARNNEILARNENGARKYPFGRLFSHPIGTPVTGGLEMEYGEYLIRDKRTRWLYFLNNSSEGTPIKTTLDPLIQAAAFNAMGRFKGAVVVLKANSGEILCSLSLPNYDPNGIEKYPQNINARKDDGPYFDRAKNGMYPPGSVWKMISVPFLMKPKDKPFFCRGSLDVGDKSFRCPHAHGKVTGVRDAFARSCNLYFIWRMVSEVKKDTFVLASKDFMTRQTIKELGLFTYSLAIIGQGPILLSPYEAAVMAATVANEGLRPTPILLKKQTEIQRILSAEDARYLQSLMIEVVRSGTGRRLSGFLRKNYIVGLKTGTAEKRSNGGMKTNIVWMVGFAGKKKPEIAFSVVIEDSALNAGEQCAPIVRGILAAYFSDTRRR